MPVISNSGSLAALAAALWMTYPPNRSLFVSARDASSSSSSREKKASEAPRNKFRDGSSFVGGARRPPERRRSSRIQSSSVDESYSSSSSIEMDNVSSGVGFDLLKARLMARFSSVAYEEPPKSARRRGMAGVEQFKDGFGVSISRPTLEYVESASASAKNDEDEWKMAHVNAMSPRPLMPMFSECNGASGGGIEGVGDPADAQFQWVGLATNERTSAQFDVWRITSPGTDMKRQGKRKGGKGTLVVAFRGTRLSSYVDLLTDIQLRQDMIGCCDFGVCMDADGGADDDNSTLMAHSGFLKAYSSIRPTLLQLLSDETNAYDDVWFTGHSLGAALATLAVVDVGSILRDAPGPITIKSMNPSSPSSSTIEQTLSIPEVEISSYLFGTPRVGNRAFAERLARLQSSPGVLKEYYRVNTPGDAVVYLPRGKVVNRLGIDYVHAGASVFLPSISSESKYADEDGEDVEIEEKMKESYGEWMMQLEEDTIGRINERILRREDDVGTQDGVYDGKKIRIYPEGDAPPDPLSEVDPGYDGFFPFDPRTWLSSESFRNFLLGEAVRSFRVLRGGFVKNHRLATYEDGLCAASQDDVLSFDPL